MKTNSQGASASVTTNKNLLDLEDSVCQASFVVHFLRGVFSKSIEGGDGITLSDDESCGLVNVMSELSQRLENLVTEVAECRVGGAS